MARRTYYDLIASLPGLPPRYDVDRSPISEVRLSERLQLLDPDDAAIVRQWFDFVHWDRQSLNHTDEDVARAYQRLQQEIANPTLWSLTERRLDTRTIVAALRHRRAGLPPPSGVGQWVEEIRRHYQHPEFQLQGRYPWIASVDRLMAQGQALAAERLMFEFTYQQLTELQPTDPFACEALLVYLARWELIERWTSLDVVAGQQRFETIIKETLGEYDQLFATDRTRVE